MVHLRSAVAPHVLNARRLSPLRTDFHSDRCRGLLPEAWRTRHRSSCCDPLCTRLQPHAGIRLRLFPGQARRSFSALHIAFLESPDSDAVTHPSPDPRARCDFPGRSHVFESALAAQPVRRFFPAPPPPSIGYGTFTAVRAGDRLLLDEMIPDAYAAVALPPSTSQAAAQHLPNLAGDVLAIAASAQS